ncbi:protein bicaudal D homolog 2-like isoform X2 [Narcine bancroftii]|uniref:protein bicaudal D homolog 2-like isoform X2 n=1 Tax=Narcine bancroftii TaxID=1343680 RepID=UPI00383109EE
MSGGGETEEIAALRAEVERLGAELAETSEQKVRAAQYGLAVLEEKQGLALRHAELEQEHETAVRELERLKEAFSEVCNIQKKVAADGENREEVLVKEAASREGELAGRLCQLQAESRQVQLSLAQLTSENERLALTVQELGERCKALELERADLREEVKERRSRESEMLQECAELEEENLQLQKAVSALRERQVEFEGLKHELRQREEAIEELEERLEEAARLKAESEREAEEALESLGTERARRGELWGQLLDDCGSSNPGACPEQDSGCQLDAPGRKAWPVSDLLTELSRSETHRLRQQLEMVEQEKATLLAEVQDLQRRLETSSRGALPPEEDEEEEKHQEDVPGSRNGARSPPAPESPEFGGRESPRLEEELTSLSQELSVLYHRLCLRAGLEPRGPSPRARPDAPGALALCGVLRGQLGRLREAAERWGAAAKARRGAEVEDEGLQAEVLKLRSLLSTKREQIATLRTVLRANKQTAEVAMSNLKNKCSVERAVVSDTMTRLRQELKTLKEDAATFSSVRALFASRCDQYVAQLEEMQQQLTAAEDEKRTLNSLLRMAIEQKLALTRRLEGKEQPSAQSSGTERVRARTRTRWRSARDGSQNHNT